MKKEEIEKTVKQSTAIWCPSRREEIKNTDTLSEIFSDDEEDIGDAIKTVEETLNISISNDEFDKIVTIQDLIDIAYSKKNI